MQNTVMGFDVPVAMATLKFEDRWRLERTNSEFCRLFGYTKEELALIKDRTTLICANDRQIFFDTLSQTKDDETTTCEVRICRNHNELRWVQATCSVLEENDGIMRRIIAIWDIHKAKTMEEQYELLEEATKEIPFEIDVETMLLLYSGHIHEIIGRENEPDRYVPYDVATSFIHPNERAVFIETMAEAFEEEIFGTLEYRLNVAKEDEKECYIWLRTFYRSIANRDGKITRIIGKTYNIERDKYFQDAVKKDPLTKLLNKVAVQHEVQEIIRKTPNQCHVMFLIDIDNFKQINDTFGHTFGDTVIVDVATQLKEIFRSDDVIGRVGGDEFLVFMRDTSLENAEEKAKSLCSLLMKEYSGDGVSHKLSISVGLSVYGRDGRDYSTLFEKADRAMYRVKESGKDGYKLAKGSDVGPIKGKKRNLETRIGIRAEDREFLMFAMSLMTHARNIDGSLNMLLRRIAAHFRLELVAIFEYKEYPLATMTNYYSEEYHYYDNVDVIWDEPEFDELKPGELFVTKKIGLDDPRKIQLMLNDNRMELAQKKLSMVIGKFEYLGGKTGLVSFVSWDYDRKWGEQELEVISELCRMIAVFVSLRHRMDESQAELRKLQKKDQVTGLYNYDAFLENANAFLESADTSKLYAIEYLDIDNFGYVNENYGYRVGDNALRIFARETAEQGFFELGCRLYSDYFIFLLSGDSEEQLKETLEQHNRKFASTQSHQYPSSSIGISAGAYIIDLEYDDIAQAVENASLAWKRAKKQRGHEVIFFQKELRQKRTEEQQIIGEFYKALYRNDFCVYMQPKFILGKQNIYGAEALARWKKEDGAVLLPGAFLEPLEKIGYIKELDFFIFEEVLKTMSRWQEEGRPQIVISVNFSGRHFEDDGSDFLNRIFHIIQRYDVAPQNIEIEITEGVFVKNLDVLKYCLTQLREKGLRTAIDDFGTGFSSLAILTDLPTDVVKMDKSFIRKDINQKQRDILMQIGKLVQITEKEIIFEGIETIEQEAFLIECGFERGQGYLCNRPIEISEFENLYLRVDEIVSQKIQ